LEEGSAKLVFIDPLTEEVADLSVEVENFEDTNTPLESEILAFGTAFALEEFFGRAVENLFEEIDFVGGGLGFDFAIRADLADEALGDSANQGGVEEIGFDIKIEEAEKSTNDVFGVEGGKNELTGEPGFDGDFGGFAIADFSNKNDVGAEAEESAQTSGKGVTNFFLNLGLINIFELEFDGIFDSGNVILEALIKLANSRVESGSFAATGRTAD
jgi:hypothetical protein